MFFVGAEASEEAVRKCTWNGLPLFALYCDLTVPVRNKPAQPDDPPNLILLLQRCSMLCCLRHSKRLCDSKEVTRYLRDLLGMHSAGYSLAVLTQASCLLGGRLSSCVDETRVEHQGLL